MIYDVLLVGKESSKYDTAIVSKNKDVNNGFQLKKEEVSEWITDEFKKNGKTIPASFRVRLMDIGEEGEKFKIYVTQIFPLSGWTYPESLADELVEECGPFLESISHFPFAFGWVDENAYVDDMGYQAKWLGKATQYLMNKNHWDLYMTQWHGIDNTEHAFLRFDDSTLTSHERTIGEKVTLSSYQIADQYVKEILEGARNSAKDEDVHTIILSDHGQIMGANVDFLSMPIFMKKDSLNSDETLRQKKLKSTGKKHEHMLKGWFQFILMSKEEIPRELLSQEKNTKN